MHAHMRPAVLASKSRSGASYYCQGKSPQCNNVSTGSRPSNPGPSPPTPVFPECSLWEASTGEVGGEPAQAARTETFLLLPSYSITPSSPVPGKRETAHASSLPLSVGSAFPASRHCSIFYQSAQCPKGAGGSSECSILDLPGSP